jgi:hypothetical protein
LGVTREVARAFESRYNMGVVKRVQKKVSESREEFKRRFLKVEIKDELFGGKGGNVVDAFKGKQYQRRQK